MTSAQIARLAAQTGDWTEPLSNGFSGSLLYDDGTIGRVEGLGANGVLTVMAGGSVDQPVVERTIPTGAFIDRNALNILIWNASGVVRQNATIPPVTPESAENHGETPETLSPVAPVPEGGGGYEANV
jgi:hypothetical protein